MKIKKDNYCWGSFTYDRKKDVLRADMKIEKLSDVIEALTIYFDENKNGTTLIIMWDDVKASLPISL